MATSQFTIYRSTDAGGPGPMAYTGGCLIGVLRACLVAGYSGKPAAGWSEPIAGGWTTSFKQGAGSSGLCLYVNDTNNTDAWLTGWETITSIDPPVGAGSGQFPSYGQILTDGHLCCYKAENASYPSSWIIIADSRTFYLLVQSGSSTSWRIITMFGDIYALNSSDNYRCLLIGSSTADAYNSQDGITWNVASKLNTGHYMPRALGGGGASHQVNKHPANGALFYHYDVNANTPMIGLMPMPNAADMSVWLSNIYIYDGCIRGKLRGLYAFPHPNGSVAEGMSIQGAGDFSAKTFQAITNIGYSTSVATLFVETSNTVDTN